MIPINGYDREEYDGDLKAKRVNVVGGSLSASSTVYVGTPTLYAVVNTSASGDPKTFIGLTTVTGSALDIRSLNSTTTLYAVVNTGGTSSNVTLNPSPNFIGLVSVTGPVRLYASDGTAFNHSGGNMLVNVQNFAIGQFGGSATVQTDLTSALAFSENMMYDGTYWVRQIGTTANGLDVDPSRAWPDPKTFIGLVTVGHTVSSSIVGNVTLSDSKTYIGLTTSTIGNAMVTVTMGTTLSASTDSVAIGGTVTTASMQLSYYNQSSLVSGYVFHGFTTPGSNPTTAAFRIQREVLNTGEVLFASGSPAFVHQWSSASLASVTYL